eukprot:CAMPEP_0198108288 /NCGR_PEP_ID=MMETSP1442-20131203/326_1 /TAXON_ID= /ORGANISM="Craspedostauros australis, Strain CCMP3328" /LENGTH=66 /DNA_ID=CAMNT_0043763517 /DNA_START=266 /DNA_END=463 /DNA_ORIENTATION=-
MSTGVSSRVVTSAVIEEYLACVDVLEDLSDMPWLKIGKRNGYLHGFSSIVSVIIRVLMSDSFVDQC